jgi:hypothetical protein
MKFGVRGTRLHGIEHDNAGSKVFVEAHR